MPAAEHRVRVYFDFASTLCYVAHRVFGAMAAELDALGVALDWLPLDLAGLLGWPRGVEVAPRAARQRRAGSRRRAASCRRPAPARIWPRLARRELAAALVARARPAPRPRSASACSGAPRSRSAATLDAPGASSAGFARDLGATSLEPRALARARDELEFRTRIAAEEDVTGVPTLMLDDFPFGGIHGDSGLA